MTVAPSFLASAMKVSRSRCQRSSLSVSRERPITGFSFEAKADAASVAAKTNVTARRRTRGFFMTRERGISGLQPREIGEACGRLTLDNPKLFSLPAAVQRRDAWRAEGKRVVLTNGVF